MISVVEHMLTIESPILRNSECDSILCEFVTAGLILILSESLIRKARKLSTTCAPRLKV